MAFVFTHFTLICIVPLQSLTHNLDRMLRFQALIALLVLLPLMSIGQTIQFVEVMSGFARPVDIANAGDGSNRLFIVDANGYVYIIDSTGALLEDPFLDISDQTDGGGEQGLLGLAFHPDYEENGYFFVNYTDLNGDTKVSRFEVSDMDQNVADTSTQAVMLEVVQPYDNHNGGCLKFSPVDEYLYIALGDGGSFGDPECRAQDSLDLLGKILRVDVDQNISTAPYYGIPSDNPFASNPDGADEVWCVGLRNPWKISFDRLTGDLWIADVGQGEQEELNFQLASSTGGENYGWKVMEGDECYDSDPVDGDCPQGTPSCFSEIYTGPIFDYPHSGTESGRSVTGGYVYRGCKFPALYGKYIMADYISGNGWLMDSLGNDIFTAAPPQRISSFGESESGELYAVSLEGTGRRLYEVRETSLPYDLEITIADDPVSGTYRAANSITIVGNITVMPGETLTLIAPEVIVQDSLVVNDPSVIVVETSCK